MTETAESWQHKHAGADVTRHLQPDPREFPEKDLTKKIIGCAIKVHCALGPGYLEQIYENALAYELHKQGLQFETQKPIQVLYDGRPVGEHRADIIVEGKVVLELKHVEEVHPKHIAQVISTLKAFKLKVGLLINFNESKVINGVTRVVL